MQRFLKIFGGGSKRGRCFYAAHLPQPLRYPLADILGR
jgi:hypothetical protein